MLTLNDLFALATVDIDSRIKSALLDDTFCMKASGMENIAIAQWRIFPSMVAQHVGKLLDIRLGDVLVGAWNKARAIRQSLDKSNKAPGKEILLELAEHTITSKHEPYLTLLRNGAQVASLKFSVNLELTLQGAMMRILNGEIKEIQVGQIRGKGTIKSGRVVLLEKELGPLEVPGMIVLAQ
jgi:hypothetical protein